MKRYHPVTVGLLLIIFAGFLVRLYKINNPILDWHSFRQADTASVTREYLKQGIHLLEPKYHDNSNIASGKDNPLGYRMVEFPLLNAGTAVLLNIFPFLPLVLTSRLLSALLSLLTIWAVFHISYQLSGKRVAFLSALFVAFLPYSVYYSRVVLPEPAMLASSTCALYFFMKWLKKEQLVDFITSLILFALSLLFKPYTIFLLPVFAVLSFYQFGKKTFFKPHLYIWGLLFSLPFFAWREWISQYPQGIPASDWLFNSDGIRFRPAWFRWLYYERIPKLITGFLAFVFFPLSLLKLSKKEAWVYGAWWLGMLAYMSIIATGNVRHDYYQVLLIPIIAITLARGVCQADLLLKKFLPGIISTAILAVICLAGIATSFYFIKGYYNINHPEYVVAGKVVDRVTPPNAKVIAPAFGDTMFLFQTNRTGWPIGFEIEDKIDKGAEYYISTSYDDEVRMLEEKYMVIEKTETYTLIDLTKSRETP